MTVRLNKHIAETGFCSRREADRLIAERRVTVNGQAAGMGAVVGEGDTVLVDGQPLKARTAKAGKRRHVYIALNKPVGVTCTTESSVRTKQRRSSETSSIRRSYLTPSSLPARLGAARRPFLVSLRGRSTAPTAQVVVSVTPAVCSTPTRTAIPTSMSRTRPAHEVSTMCGI